ncbi:TPA: CPBP family intramembrane metalloprotease [Streptococcus suis]|uniref:CPBP family intramembrane glutamic endopeptidase n=1 Tax=Streptococcus suis TaxID=1307 RepID=UPI0015521F39|nr:type II CAAX endopeptidase family protein [Streptococcus suis]MCQ8261993.1 CPBP family intramembrane metalloprotease [Streptococcus suis]NQI35809.1 CPBP family intramembrane metalloprotease [Streptococcus suis]NQI37682.1 CPBP family intramembrane metalloprotease [Streptococcus suis]NQI47351.1 CPBP family intramembrane metalloprotease [Streptococcus suis]HEL2027784.1 CPBP family intramembrane metalloprotease [Streptococcus suis]
MVHWIKSIVQVLLLTLVIQVPFIAEMSWGNMDDTLIGYLIHVICWILLTILVFWLLDTLRKKYRDYNLEVKNYSYIKLFGLVILGIIIKIVLLNVSLRLSGSTVDNSSMLELFQSKYGWMALLSTNTLSPIREEYLYRGIFQERIRNKAYPMISVFVTTAIFAFVHTYNISVSFWMTFFPGLVFSWVYYKTNHLKYPILAHIASNIIVTFFNFIS